MLNVAEPFLGPDDKKAVLDVIDSGWITMGERVRQFEQAFAKLHAAEDAVAVSSCTAGLHLIMLGLGLGPGDEVLVPAMTFVATPNSVLYVGATPVFVDIDSNECPLMSIEDAAAKCTDKTKAIILVHYAGYLSDREKWQNFADERGLLIVEDAAHASGLVEAGTFGVAAAFSFYGNKNMTTAEGGAVIATLPGLSERIRQARGHGLTSGTFQRHSGSAKCYDVTMLGYNYRIDELRAALGLAQLQNLMAWNEKRKMLTELYREMLWQRTPAVLTPFSNSHKSAYHIMPVVLPEHTNRQTVVNTLRSAGVQTTIHYPPAHRFSYYTERLPHAHLPNTEVFADRELTLPLHPKLNEQHVDQVTQALASALEVGGREWEQPI